MRDVFWSCLNGSGDIKEATRILGTFPPDARLAVDSWEVEHIIGDRAYLEVIKRDFAAALTVWDKEDTSDPTARRMRLSARAAIHVLAGDAAGAQNEMEQARALVEARLRERPDDKNALIQLSWIDLGQNRNAEALR